VMHSCTFGQSCKFLHTGGGRPSDPPSAPAQPFGFQASMSVPFANVSQPINTSFPPSNPAPMSALGGSGFPSSQGASWLAQTQWSQTNQTGFGGFQSSGAGFSSNGTGFQSNGGFAGATAFPSTGPWGSNASQPGFPSVFNQGATLPAANAWSPNPFPASNPGFASSGSASFAPGSASFASNACNMIAPSSAAVAAPPTAGQHAPVQPTTTATTGVGAVPALNGMIRKHESAIVYVQIESSLSKFKK
jgi:hypothetical protein